MHNFQSALRLVLLLTALFWGAAASSQVSYRARIAPILVANCNACHGKEVHQSGLDTTTFATLMKGGKRGVSVIAGDPAKSLLLQFVDGRKQPRMPIGGTLKPAEIALVKDWIAAGAKFDGEPAASGPVKSTVTVKAGILPQVAALAFSKDGSTLAVGLYLEVLLFDMNAVAPPRVLKGHADVIRSLAFSPDGAILAAAGGMPGAAGEVKLWDWKSGTLTKTLVGHTDNIYSVAWRPDGKQMATASYDKLLKFWDPTTGKSTMDLRDHADAVYGCGYTPSGKWMVSAGADRSLRVWDTTSGKRLYTIGGHAEGINALAMHPAADQAVTGGIDKAARLWNIRAENGDNPRTFQGQQETIYDVKFSPDGKWIAVASGEGRARIYDKDSGGQVRDIKVSEEPVLSLSFSPDGKRLAAGGYDGSVTIYKTTDGTVEREIIAMPKRPAPKGKK